MDVDVGQLKTLFEQIVFTVCRWALAAVAVAYVGIWIVRALRFLRAAARRSGWAFVLIALGFAFAATLTGTVTQGDKDTYNEERDAAACTNLVLGAILTPNPGGFAPITSTNTTRTLTAADFRRGFVLARTGEDETFDFSAPANAVRHGEWLDFGAAEDWFRLALEDWEFTVGTNAIAAFTVFSRGRVVPESGEAGDFLSPFEAALGIVPLARHGLLAPSSAPSQFWHAVSPSNTLQLTWQNVLLDRCPEKPVSFQLELFPGGAFRFRYDWTRAGMEAVSNVLVGASLAGGVWTQEAIMAHTTSLMFQPLLNEDAVDMDRDGDGLATIDEIFVHGTDPGLADTDGDGLDDAEELSAGTDPWLPDTDGDGLEDGAEIELGTNPLSPDGDADTLGDREEVLLHGTDPNLPDTDGDGASDAVEVAAGTDPLKTDTDSDGLSDGDELDVGTDPLDPDTDGDGAPDGWEVDNGADPLCFDADIDGDGLDDDDERLVFGTSPLLADTDGDGLSDAAELAFATNLVATNEVSVSVKEAIRIGVRLGLSTDPLKADTDGDGLDDGDEFGLGTDPCSPDTDGDGLLDGEEVAAGASPFLADTDDDGMPDVWEVEHGLDPNDRHDASADADGDRLANLREFQSGTSPCAPDTDGDGLSDYVEVTATGTSPCLKDTDGDGLDDAEEGRLHTSPTNPDSDFDGLPDGWEVKHGLDPRNATGIDGASGDPDGDGLGNLREYELGTSPRAGDTDGDGADDGMEVGCIRRRYVIEDWASVSNGWAAVEVVRESDGAYDWFSFDAWIKIGGEWMYDAVCQWNGLILAGSDYHYPEDVVTVAPTNLAEVAVSGAALTVAPYWVSRAGDDPAPAISVFRRGTITNLQYAVQYVDMPARGTNTVSFQVVLSFTNAVYCGTEINFAEDTSDAVNGLNASIGVRDAVNDVAHSVGCGRYVVLPTQQRLMVLPGLGTDPCGAVDDADGDGLSDGEEARLGTDPRQPDTDGDGLNDGWEAKYGFDPLVDNRDDDDVDPDHEDDPDADPDMDGLRNREEADFGTDPFNDDTDDDGVPDGEEVENSSDPNDATDGGRPASRVPVDFTFGDPSGSHSEKYRLVVEPCRDPDGNEPDGDDDRPKTFRWVDANYGACETKTAMLRRGWTYSVRMFHAGTDPDYADVPDYDYSLALSHPSCVGVVTNDPERLFTDFDGTSSRFAGEGKVAYVLVLDGCLVGDYDRRDGFGDHDLSRVYRGKPLRHWINDDDDEGDTNDSEGDAPGHGRRADYDNAFVDGNCDVLDFTPVWMDMGKALQQLTRMKGDGKAYELYLFNDDGAVNVVWTSLTTNMASSFLTTSVMGCGESLSENLPNASTVRLTEEGVKVPVDLLHRMKDDRASGIFLFEGRRIEEQETSSAPIVLRCYTKPRALNETPVFELSLPLSISSVEEMFRWKSFRGHSGEEDLQVPDRTGDPFNLPDSEVGRTNIVFVHGANVSEQNARAWMSEMFKRFHQSGANARFHGVTWRSNIGNGANYQEDVSNAFVTAEWLADYAAGIGGPKIVVAHSLGNVVVSSAITDWDMDVTSYFMCNAAVPSEAVFPEVGLDDRLVHKDWRRYPSMLYSCNWYKNFDARYDSRGRLTWNGRFTNVIEKAVNLYSSGDHVFELFRRGNPPWWAGLGSWTYFAERYCWQKQELGKGTLPAAVPLGRTEWAGWGFERNWRGTRRKRPVPREDEPISLVELSDHPAFRLRPGWMDSKWLSRSQRNSLLAVGIPTLSPAVGNQELMDVFSKPDRCKNLQDGNFRPNGWPNRGREWLTRWLHGDMKDVAYFYNFKLYEFILKHGGLK